MTDAIERWRGKTAIVTGVSSGIGRAIATLLAREGLKVVLAARRRERLGELEAELAPHDVMAVPTDLRDERQILELFAKTRERFGGVDVLVNNAGLGHLAPLASGKTADWREMLDVNVIALSICTREAVKDMQRRSVEGHVIHVSSMAGHRVPPGSAMYAASKFAVRALTEALRQELRALESPIRVSAVSPGYVETEFAAHYQKSEEAAKRTYGRFKVLESEDVAAAVRYLLATPPHVEVHDILMRPREQPQ